MKSDVSLPNGWIWASLYELGEIVTGNTPPRSGKHYYGGSVPWIKPDDLDRSLYVSSSAESLSDEGARIARVLPEGAVLVSCIGKLGKSAIAAQRLATNQQINSVIPGSAATPRYLYYALKSRQAELDSVVSGTVVPIVNKSVFSQLRVPVAPLSEQRRIVEAIEAHFTRLDAGVASLKRVQSALKRYRAALLKAAVEGKLTEAWRAAHPDVEPAPKLLERILAERRARWEADLRARGKDPAKAKYDEPQAPDTTELRVLPDGWVWASAEQLSDETRAITYGVVKLGDPVDGGVPTLRSSNVRHLSFELDGLKSISPEIAGQYKRTFLQGGEIVVTVRGTLGGVAVVPPEFAGYNISREVAMIALVDPRTASCAAMFVGSPPIERWIMQNTKGIAYTGINIETLKELPLPLPSLTEQEQIVSEVERRLSVVSELEAAVEANLKRAERLRQSILERAFSGRLVPQDPRDEPASALLERIRAERVGKQGAAKERSSRKAEESSGDEALSVMPTVRQEPMW